MARFSFFLFASFTLLAFKSWGADVGPSDGFPGTIVQLENLPAKPHRLALRDASNTETELSVGSEGVFFASVPSNQAPGNYVIRLTQNVGGPHEDFPFTVLDNGKYPGPRIDDITASGVAFSTSQPSAQFFMMVHGANFDVGSEIIVNGVSQPTGFYRLLRNRAQLHGGRPIDLGYPILHYATLFCQIELDTGSVSRVSVRNLDGTTSEVMDYEVGFPGSFDSDGDGLPDVWEETGDFNGDQVVDLDLPGLGADPLRKDLFVEVDWMAGAEPNQTIWSLAEAAFKNAPVLNSDGSQGIAIHIDRGQNGGQGGTVLPFTEYIGFGPDNPDPNFPYVDFYGLKGDPNHFDPQRLRVYHYCIFAFDNAYQHSSSGQAEAIWGNDFFVSLANNGPLGQQQPYQIGTFLHELGHTLNLRHGGFEHVNRKPNYNSIMQYGRGGNSPGQFFGVDVDCDLKDKDLIFTFSQGMRHHLFEHALNESKGCCGNVATDWDGNGTIDNTAISRNLDDGPILRMLRDHADWRSMKLGFAFGGSDWNSN